MTQKITVGGPLTATLLRALTPKGYVALEIQANPKKMAVVQVVSCKAATSTFCDTQAKVIRAATHLEVLKGELQPMDLSAMPAITPPTTIMEGVFSVLMDQVTLERLASHGVYFPFRSGHNTQYLTIQGFRFTQQHWVSVNDAYGTSFEAQLVASDTNHCAFRFDK